MTKFKVDMRDFLRTGNFGPIRLGMTRKQVEHLLGKPQGWGGRFPWQTGQLEKDRSYNDCPVWIYDDMEFHFGEQQLFLIYCDHLDRLKSRGDVFNLNRWVLEKKPPTREQVEHALVEEDINYTHKRLEYFGKLVLASGVDITYEYDDICSVSVVANLDTRYHDAPNHLSQEAT
jgi:hypothetical protein